MKESFYTSISELAKTTMLRFLGTLCF